jgi:lysophospholipase L1-like esterase
MKHCIRNSFLVMLGLLILGEIGVRCFLPASFTSGFEYGFNPTAGFEEHADGSVHLLASRGRKFHPQTFQRQKPEGVMRIFVIGDSVEYFDDEMHFDPPPLLAKTYPALLGPALKTNGVNAESISLAVEGNGSRRAQLVLRQALKYNPSLIVLKLSDRNDAWEEENFQRAQEFKSWHLRNWLRKSYLIQALIVLKEEQFLKRLPRKIQTANRATMPPDIQPVVNVPAKLDERFCRTVRESVALARAQNVPILLLTQAMTETDASGQLVLGDHGLSDFAEELRGPGVYCLSMKQFFAGCKLENLYLDHMHFRHAGHQLVANALAQKIIAEQIKP